MSIIKTIIDHWAIFVAIGGAWAVVYTTIRVKVPDIDKRLRNLEKMELVTKAHCADMQTNCQQLICGKIENVKVNLAKMDAEREKARDQLYNELKEIVKFMGRVEQFMQDRFE